RPEAGQGRVVLSGEVPALKHPQYRGEAVTGETKAGVPVSQVHDLRVHSTPASQAFSRATPVQAESPVSRVTPPRTCTRPVATTKPARSGRGSGTCRAAQRRAISTVTGKMRPAKAGST